MLLDNVIDFSQLMRKLLRIIFAALINQEETQSQEQAADSNKDQSNNVNEALSELL